MSIHLDPTIFRAYDIRGIAGEQLTPSIIYAIGRAIGSAALERDETTLLLAQDGRLSGEYLLHALSEGIRATGCHVVDMGIIPTPLLYFATHELQIHSAVMLTASHNPAHYNGLKIVLKAETLSGEHIHALYDRIQDQQFAVGEGSYRMFTDIISRYKKNILDQIQLKRSLHIVMDCAHSVTSLVAPELFNALGCRVTKLFCDLDPNFPAHPPDPSQAKNLEILINTVLKEKADLGIAFDGDGDRLGVVSSTGEIIWPDQLMMIYLKDILSKNNNKTVIYDVKCSHKMTELIHAHQGNPILYRTGHSFIKAKMQETQAIFAGEMSGHLYFADRWFGFDDGLYAAARLLELISHDHQPIEHFFQTLPHTYHTPELQMPMADNKKFLFIEQIQKNTFFDKADICLIDGLRVNYADGWGLIRASNTAPLIVMRFEADSETSLRDIQEIFRQQLLTIDPELKLPF